MRALKKSGIDWGGRVPNPSNADIKKLNCLQSLQRKSSIFRVLIISAKLLEVSARRLFHPTSPVYKNSF